MHTVNNRTQLISCVHFLYEAGELIVTQPYFVPATSVTIYPLGTHVVRISATEHHPSLSLNHHLGAFPVRISHARIQSYKSSDRGRESVITEENKTWETPRGK